MFGGCQTKEHNIHCINQILGLNIPQITTAVRNAVRKYNIFDGDRPTNTDLLCIVFECLASYLDNLNLQNVRANEESLVKEIDQITQILQIVNVGRYLKSDYQFRISNVISAKASNNMVSLTSSGLYLEAEKVFRNKETHAYAKLLGLIADVTRVTDVTPENSLSPSQLKFWFQDVIPLIFHQNKDIQNSAMQAVEAALPLFLLSPYQDHPNWPALEESITTEYPNFVIIARDQGDSLWYKMWNVLVKLLNKKLLKGAAVINKFLSICENGFKSPSFKTRAETFLSWKVLLEIYAQDTKYLSAKRIKLLLIPFKPIAKTPEIAVNKFLVWWSLICKIENQLDQYYDTILAPFLCFCFGLTEKPILSITTDVGTRQEVYPQLITLSISALINLLGPLDEATNSICNSALVERIQAPLVLPSLLQNVGRFLINSCGEATYLLRKMKLVDAIPICNNLWSNMMNRMKENSETTLTELLIQNLIRLHNATKTDDPAKRLVTHSARIVLSSENLIQRNISDDVRFGIFEQIAELLTISIMQFNDKEQQEIIDNVFKLTTGTKRLLLPFQHILTLLQSQKLPPNIGVHLWLKVANYVRDNLTENIDTYQELIYGYIEWVVKDPKIDQLTVLMLSTWKNLATFLLNNDSGDVFWYRMCEILRLGEEYNRIYKFIATVFELIKPEDPLVPSFKSLIVDVVKSTPPSYAKELQPIIDNINKFSEQIRGEHSSETYESLDDLVNIIEKQMDYTMKNQSSIFSNFRKNFEKFSASQKSQPKPSKRKDDEFVFIPSKWQFRPDNLTEHQREKLKEKRVDIPALYNDMSQSQDSQSVSLKPWTPKKPLQSSVVDLTSEAADANHKQTSSDTTEKTNNDVTNGLHQSQPNSQTMECTSLDSNSSTDNSVSQSTSNKVDDEERKRKRIQYELNKLELSIANADEYRQPITRRRTSVTITKPDQKILRKRALIITTKVDSPKRVRRSSASTNIKGSESSDVIEASQTLPSTPTTRRLRQKKSETPIVKQQKPNEEKVPAKSETPIVRQQKPNEEKLPAKSETQIVRQQKPNGEKVPEKSETPIVKQRKPNEEKLPEVEVISDANVEKNLLLNISLDSRSIDEKRCKENDKILDSLEEVLKSDTTPVKDKNLCYAQDNEDSTKVETVPDVESTIEISTEIPQETNDHAPIETAHSEVIPSISEDILASSVGEHAHKDLIESDTSGIITSPSSNKNCPKTTELLNSTVNISPIHYPKHTNADQTLESKNRLGESLKETNVQSENIDKDQIKRSELDNLIKSPMDSPMLLTQKPFSTPQSHKDTKRTFQLQGGRGAQLLQLMNIRKVEKTKVPVNVCESTAAPTESIPSNANNLPSYEDILSTNKDLFRFTKALPSPLASPSNSIMKRNITTISDVDDIESPNQKRKRVSFHDPPVSATKEFIRFTEEVNPNRSRISRSVGSPVSARHILTRRSRTDSLNEIKKFTLPFDDKSEDSMESLKCNDTTDDEGEASVSPLITFTNKEDMLQHVLHEYPMEEVLSKYFESGFTLNESSSKIFANQLANFMETDETKRKLYLEDLQEKFPKEFLTVAFQENLTSTVMERIPPTNMLTFITQQAKTDKNLKQQLMDAISSVLADSASSSEMDHDVHKLLLEIISNKMSDDQLLHVMDKVFEKRRTNS